MKSATTPVPSHPISSITPSSAGHSTRIRKPRKRPMTNSHNQTRTRATRSTSDPNSLNMTNNNNPHQTRQSKANDCVNNSSSPSDSQHKNSDLEHNESNQYDEDPNILNDEPEIENNNQDRPEQTHPNILVMDDMVRAFQDVSKLVTDNPEALFLSSFPDSLERTSRPVFDTAMNTLHDWITNTKVAHPPKSDPKAFISVLTSEMDFHKKQRELRDAAKASLFKVRSERHNINRAREKLISESKMLSEQIGVQKRLRAEILDRKAENETIMQEDRQAIDQGKKKYSQLQDELEKAKFNELDVRRKLDRCRLKVAALRGEMITATVDQLAEQRPKWLGDLNEFVTSSGNNENSDRARKQKGYPGSGSGPPEGSAISNESPENITHNENEQATEKIEIQPDEETGDVFEPGMEDMPKIDYDLDESSEEMEFRLLQNRLNMCETEAREWRDCVDSERTKVQMITRAKIRLEEEYNRVKPGNMRSSAAITRSASKHMSANARATAKVRATIRATLATISDPQQIKKPTRKSRKSQPKKSLVL